MTHFPSEATETLLLVFLIAFIVIGLLDWLGMI